MGSLNKAQLIEKLSKEMNTTKADAERFLDCFVDTVQKNVKRGHDIKLVGFGTFTKAKRKARMGRNPQTGKPLKIPASWVPKFRPGSEFKSLCN
jgi:DNA-binding protein HU-beta